MEKNKLIIRPRGDDGKRVFSIRIDQEIYARIDALAAKSGRSRNEIITQLLEFALDNTIVES